MDLSNFKHSDWEKYFSGRWSILSASYWGKTYTDKNFSKYIDQYVTQSILIYDSLGLTGFFRKSEIELFSKTLGRKIEVDSSMGHKICDGLKDQAKTILTFIENNINKDITFEKYSEYCSLVDSYYRHHISNKYVPEGLSPDVLNSLLSKFEEARIVAEPVFMRTEEFMKGLAKIHSEKTTYSPEEILATINTEFENYMKVGVLPSKDLIEKRINGTALISSTDLGTSALVGENCDQVKNVLQKEKTNDIKGKTAYPGQASGIVRIVLNPAETTRFEKGDILVAKMTRPDYLHLMEKSAAFVTDAGGILSHAAIVAREMKKPCVIGTQNATEILKDGMKVKVDADNGTVKII